MKTGPAKAAQSSTAARVSTVRETAHRETEGLAGSALRLQRSAGNRAVSSLLAPAGDLPLLLQGVLSGPGRPLDGTVRGPMEAGFGRAFDGVRIHTDERAAASARALNAAAYMWGRHIVFGAGRFAPGNHVGKNHSCPRTGSRNPKPVDIRLSIARHRFAPGPA